MDTITASQALLQLQDLDPDTKLCPYCYAEIVTDDDGEEYCSNDMCLYTC